MTYEPPPPPGNYQGQPSGSYPGQPQGGYQGDYQGQPAGYYQGQPPGYYEQQPRRSSGLAIAALVCGVLALLSSWTVIGGILLGIVAVVLGFVALSKIKRGLAAGRGMAITGIVTGVLGAVLAIALIAVGVSLLNSDSGQRLQDCLADAGNDDAAIAQCQRQYQDDLGG